MSPLDLLRVRRPDDDELPAVASDDELVAWGRSLASLSDARLPARPRRIEPLRARPIPLPEQRIRLRPRAR